eukprot:4327153-Amphidinium_carterae.1
MLAPSQSSKKHKTHITAGPALSRHEWGVEEDGATDHEFVPPFPVAALCKAVLFPRLMELPSVYSGFRACLPLDAPVSYLCTKKLLVTCISRMCKNMRQNLLSREKWNFVAELPELDDVKGTVVLV